MDWACQGFIPNILGLPILTDKYQEDAAIAAVEVFCTPELCSY